MISYISNSILTSNKFNNLNIDEGLSLLNTVLSRNLKKDDLALIAIDTETNGLDPYQKELITLQIGDTEDQLVFDVTNKDTIDNVSQIINKYNNKIRWLGSNIKFDHKMLIVNANINMKYFYDIMIAEQRIYMGLGRSNRLDAMEERYLGIVTDRVSKDIRNDFASCTDVTKFRFKEDHIVYGAQDIISLYRIHQEQNKRIDIYKMHRLLYDIEFPLIAVLAESELEGFVLNESKWKKNTKKSEKIKLFLEIQLDKEFRKLRKTVNVPEHKKVYITGGKFDRKRISSPILKPNTKVIGLFGEEVIVKVDSKANKSKYISYTSSQEVIKIFGALGLELPDKYGNKHVPKVNLIKGLKNFKIEYDNVDGITTDAKVLESFLIANYDIVSKKFLKLLLEHRKETKAITTYGTKFIKTYTNPHTSRVHTIFRQCVSEGFRTTDQDMTSPVNGRLSSGDSKNGYYNSQNIPRDNKYRKCFLPFDTIIKGDKVHSKYNIITCDLSGAEVTFIADKANDPKLLELSKQDIHSYMATKGWRNIYLYRLGIKLSLWNNPFRFRDVYDAPRITAIIEEQVHISRKKSKKTKKDLDILNLYNKAKDYLISKKTNSDKRQSCKNLTFGSIYGCHAKKAGLTINVPKDEGQIYIDTIKKEIPSTFRLMYKQVKQAKEKGFLVFNERTNSRIWFPDALRVIENNSQANNSQSSSIYDTLSFKEEVSIDGQARNTPISGSQADAIKEAMVDLYNFIKENSLDCKILKQVHDELVVRFPKDLELIDYKGVSMLFPDIVKTIMCEACNRYLNTFKMNAEYEIAQSWVK